MQINLWYNETMKEWRWTLVDSELNMESGGQPDLRLAMNDVANTVEYLIDKELTGLIPRNLICSDMRSTSS